MSGASFKTFFGAVATALAAMAGGNWAVDKVQTVEFQQSLAEFPVTAMTAYERFIHGGTVVPQSPPPAVETAAPVAPAVVEAPQETAPKPVKTAENATPAGATVTDVKPQPAAAPEAAPVAAPVAAPAAAAPAKPDSVGAVADKLLAQLREVLAEPGAPAAPSAAEPQPAKPADQGAQTTVAAAPATAPVVEAEPEPASVRPPDMPSVVLSFAELQYADKGEKSGTVILGGRAEPGASLRFAVDGEKLGKASADADGLWRLTADRALEVGPHWLTAEQIDAKGDTVARAESPFDRAQPPAPAAAAPQPQATAAETVVAKAETPAEAPAAATAAAAPETKEVVAATAAAPAAAEAPAPAPAAPAAAPAMSAETAPAPAAEPAPQPAATAMSGSGAKPEAAAPAPVAAMTAEAPKPVEAQKAAESGKDGAGVDIKQTASKLWDSFKGIFTVDPAELRKQPGEGAPVKAEERLATAGGEAGKDGAQAQPEAAGAGKLHFTSVGHHRGRSGDALRLAGSAEPGSRIRLYDGDEKLGEVVADHEGAWSFLKRGKVATGAHMFRAGRVARGGRIEAEARMQYDQVASAEPAAQPRPEMGSAVKEVRKAVATRKVDREPKMASAERSAKAGKSKPQLAKAGKSERGAKSPAGGKSHVAKDERKVASRVRVHTGNEVRSPAARHVRVSKGDTLLTLARSHCGSSRKFQRIYQANKSKIKHADVIHTGDELKIVCD
jgi:nucleoid-associated protein YgaU